VRDLVMAAQRGAILKPANPPGGRDYRAVRDVSASDDPYTLVRLSPDGQEPEHTRRFRDTGEWIMEMDAVYPIGNWRVAYLPPQDRSPGAYPRPFLLLQVTEGLPV
jgi:hypothetical protein